MRRGGPLWVTLISARLPEPTELQTQEVPLAMPRTPLPSWVSLFYLISFFFFIFNCIGSSLLHAGFL